MKLKVYHNSTLYPDRAGLAQLIYKDQVAPSRNADVITIPKDNYGLYILENTSQFLLLQQGEQKRAWFGGTDEQPFLVELSDTNYDEGSRFYSLWEKHEFYEEIKPEIIRLFEKKYGKEKTLRQGDFFFYPLPKQTWSEVLLWAAIFSYRSDIYTCKQGTSGLPLKETRHRFWGEICGDIVAKGQIIAPDHKILEFDAIHILAQTKHMKEPQKAD